jgi:ribosome-interacting GTPase 1
MFEFEGIHLQIIDTPPIDREYIEHEFLDLIKNSDLLLVMVDLKSYPIQQFQNTVEILEQNRILPLHKKLEINESRTNFLPMIVAVNKDDGVKLDEDFDVLNELLREEGWILLPISVEENRNIYELFQFIIKEMELIRVYSKRPHQDADKSQPFVLKKGATVDEFAAKVHLDFIEKLKNARIWGAKVHDGQMVGKDHILQDGDVVELHI